MNQALLGLTARGRRAALGPPSRGTYGLVHVYPSRPPAASQGRLRGSRLPVSPRRQTHHSFYGPSGAEQSQDPNIAVGRARTAVRARRTDTVAGNPNPRHGPIGWRSALHSQNTRKMPCQPTRNHSLHRTSHAKRSQNRQCQRQKLGEGSS